MLTGKPYVFGPFKLELFVSVIFARYLSATLGPTAWRVLPAHDSTRQPCCAMAVLRLKQPPRAAAFAAH